MSSEETKTIRKVLDQCIGMIRRGGDYERISDEVANKLFFLEDWLATQNPADVAAEDKRQKAHGREVNIFELILNIEDLAFELHRVRERLDALESVPSNALIGGL